MKIVVGRYNDRISRWLNPKIAEIPRPEILPRPGTGPEEEVPQELKELLGMEPASGTNVAGDGNPPALRKPPEEASRMKLPEPWKAGVCAVMAVAIVAARRRFGGSGSDISVASGAREAVAARPAPRKQR